MNSNLLEVTFVSEDGDDSSFEWFEYDINNKDFKLKWSYKLENFNNLELLKADIDGVWVKSETTILLINSDGLIDDLVDPYLLNYSSILSKNIILNNNKIIINKSIVKDGKYKSLSLIDLDNDSIVEVVAVNVNGNIDAFDLNLYNKNGFPLYSNADSPIFSMNLFDDIRRELVYQNNNGEIIILNYEGNVVDEISTKYKLVSLGSYQGEKGILTDKSFFAFIDDNKNNFNEWRYPFSSADNSRYLQLKEPISNRILIVDKKLSYAYPNPSSGEAINFRLKLGFVENIDIFIYDIAGFSIKRISLQNLGINNQIFEIPWDISNIESGVYIARIVVKNRNSTDEKIIKLGIAK
jgi:hypothetical protein